MISSPMTPYCPVGVQDTGQVSVRDRTPHRAEARRQKQEGSGLSGWAVERKPDAEEEDGMSSMTVTGFGIFPVRMARSRGTLLGK